MQAPGMEGREALVRGARAKEARVVVPPRGVGEGKVDEEGGRVEGQGEGHHLLLRNQDGAAEQCRPLVSIKVCKR